MSAELAIKIAAVARVAALIVAVIAAAASAWARARDGTGRGTTAQDAERALGHGAATVMTYELAAAGMAGAPPTAPEVRADRCAICLWEYAGRGGELVRVVPACGHFFHAECGVDGCLRKRGTCPLCRGGLWPLPECPPMPPINAGGSPVRFGGDGVAAVRPSLQWRS